MDRPQRKSRRSSILKVRQTEVVSEKVTVEDDTNKQVMKRRVSFHNVKTVQNFEKDNLNLLGRFAIQGENPGNDEFRWDSDYHLNQVLANPTAHSIAVSICLSALQS
ncbi:hypothetical protein OSTOST_17193, partial [Ostertagia ostertagi]